MKKSRRLYNSKTINYFLTFFLLNIIILSSVSAYEFELPKNFFIKPSTGAPDVVIVVGVGANESDMAYASLLATAICSLSEKNIDPIDLIKLDIEINTASLQKNLVLVGGPVSNSIVRDLGNMGASTVNWSTSPGEWEWIADPFGRGYDVLIVAGSNREATKIAVQQMVYGLGGPENISLVSSVTLPALEPLPPTITQTLDSSTCNNLAEMNKILLDENYEIMGTIVYSGTEYVVVNYYNMFSSCNGIEIISSEGLLLEDGSRADDILRKLAWVKASQELSESDLTDMEKILYASQDIYDSVYPISTITYTIVNSIKDIENNLLLNIGWSALKLVYPEIKSLVEIIQNINLELNEWIAASQDNMRSLPKVISGLRTLRSGGDVPEDIERTLNNGISSLNKMNIKVNEVNSYVGDARNKLSVFLKLTNDYQSIQRPLQNLDNGLKSFQDDVQKFSSSMIRQSSNLQIVISDANSNLNMYQSLWDNRRNALTRIYTYLGIIAASLFFLLIIIFLIYRKSKRKNNTEKEAKIDIFPSYSKLVVGIERVKYKWIECPDCGINICPKCKSKVESGRITCDACGWRAKRICVRCNKEVNENLDLCDNCGAELRFSNILDPSYLGFLNDREKEIAIMKLKAEIERIKRAKGFG